MPDKVSTQKQKGPAQLKESLSQMKALAQEVAAAWKSPKSGVDLISEQRR